MRSAHGCSWAKLNVGKKKNVKHRNTIEIPYNRVRTKRRGLRAVETWMAEGASLRLLDGGYAMRSLEQKVLTYASEREGGFAGVLKSAANAEFAQV